MIKNTLLIIIILLTKSTDATCQHVGKVGDSVNLDNINSYCHKIIAGYINTEAPDYHYSLASGKLLTNENAKGKLQFLLICEPQSQLLSKSRFCPIQELAKADTNFIFAAVMMDTSGLSSLPGCPSGPIQYALTTPAIHQHLQFKVGYPVIVIVAKNGTIADIITAIDLRLYDAKSYEKLAQSMKQMLRRPY